MSTRQLSQDLFPRETAEILKVPYSRVKITFDVTCLAVTAGLTFCFLGHIKGLGIGTILAAFTMGKVIGMIGNILDKHFRVVSFLTYIYHYQEYGHALLICIHFKLHRYLVLLCLYPCCIISLPYFLYILYFVPRLLFSNNLSQAYALKQFLLYVVLLVKAPWSQKW